MNLYLLRTYRHTDFSRTISWVIIKNHISYGDIRLDPVEVKSYWDSSFMKNKRVVELKRRSP